jgi:hypothetical protein
LAASNPTPSNLQSSTDSSISHEISFVSGTPILTKEGRKSAEDIVAGVSVWATDPTTHKSGYHTVTRVSLNSTDHLMQLLTDSREKIEATPDSLFWVNTKGWIEAKSLFPGEQLLQKDGTFAHVFNVIPVRAPATKVYSIEVEGFHTFYVGKTGLLVHNALPKLTTN